MCCILYNVSMTPCKKIDIENIVKTLPEDTSIEEVMEKLYLFAKIERGLQQADQGELLDHADVEKRLEKWLD